LETDMGGDRSFQVAGNKFFKIAALPQRHAAAYELLGLRRCG
jgi:hypothetical protein